jgi:hypothetical protein
LVDLREGLRLKPDPTLSSVCRRHPGAVVVTAFAMLVVFFAPLRGLSLVVRFVV